MERATAWIIPLPEKHAICWLNCPMPGATSSTAGPTRLTGWVVDFDAAGRLTVTVLEKLGVPRESDFYLCGPPAFLEEFTAGLGSWGVARDRVHTEIFGSGKSITPGVKEVPRRLPHAPAGSPRRGSKNLICSRRPHGLLGSQVPEPAGARGSLRRSGALVLPDRSLPYL